MIVTLSVVSVAMVVQDRARCLVNSSFLQAVDSHRRYLSEMNVKSESELVRSKEGAELQQKLWYEYNILR